MRTTHSFRQPRRPRTERQKPTNIRIRLPLRNPPRLNLLQPLPLLNQILHIPKPLHLPLQQENTLLRNPRRFRRLDRHTHTLRQRHQKLRIRLLQRVRHFLDIVRRARAADLPADAQSRVHGDGIPYRILREQGYRIGWFETVFTDQRGGKVRCGGFDVGPREGFLGDGVVVAS